MAFSFAEIAAHNKIKQDGQQEQYRNALKEKIHTGQQMSELFGDPRFMRWVKEVEDYRQRAMTEMREREYTLLSQLLPHDKYIVVKLEQSAWQASCDAYTTCLKIAKNLMAEGEQAREELKDVL